MGTVVIDEQKYGKLLASTLPRVISTDEELDRAAEMLENLHFPERKLSAEEEALADLLLQLIQAYDDKFDLPEVPPHEALKILMRERELLQADLVEVVGSRAQVSEIVSGRRGISKAQAKRLAEFFRVPADLFI